MGLGMKGSGGHHRAVFSRTDRGRPAAPLYKNNAGDVSNKKAPAIFPGAGRVGARSAFRQIAAGAKIFLAEAPSFFPPDIAALFGYRSACMTVDNL